MFVYLDTETTGLNPTVHQVWEIAYALDDEPIQKGYVPHTLVNADAKALEIGGYDERIPDLIAGGPLDEYRLQSILIGRTLVAANPHFDASFLNERWRTWGKAPWKYRMLDIEAYAAGVLGWDLPKGLAGICEALGVTPGDHTAAGDVHALRKCHRALRALAGAVKPEES